MTIKEWLTPDFFAVNVILVTLIMCFTIFGIVSNFTVDFKMSDRVQTGVYSSALATTLIYTVMVIMAFAGVMQNYPYLYDNKYNFLLLGTGETWGGNGPVFVSIIAGIIIGALVGRLFGASKQVKISMGIAAVISEALIAAFTLLWIVSQT